MLVLHVVVDLILQRAEAIRTTLRVLSTGYANSLTTRLNPIGRKVHVLSVLLDLRVCGLLINLALAVVDFVKEVHVVDAEHLIL